MSLRAATVLLAVAAALAAAPTAAADGDPASDVLVTQDAYLSYSPPPSRPLAKTLVRLLDDLREKGFPMKVALINSRSDLGAYPRLFGRPDRYAQLLAKEIAFAVPRAHLLVVMPQGFGSRNLGPKAVAALEDVEIGEGEGSDPLARAALEAVAKVATTNGYPTEAPEITAEDREDGGGSASLVYLAAGLCVLAGLGLIGLALLRRDPIG